MRSTQLNIHAQTFDVGVDHPSADAFVASVIDIVQTAWNQGADVVLLPEYLWLGLERFVSATEERTRLQEVANLFWNDYFDKGKLDSLLQSNKLCVLGTVPTNDAETLRNRAIIASNGHWHFQDKLCMTPWEKTFTGGDDLHIFEFRDCRCAVMICLDVEIPEHAAALRGKEIDLLLVPSATESILGVERIARCASARSVELGCIVVVSHVTGDFQQSILVDENIGRASIYFPSQQVFSETIREQHSDIVRTGEVVANATLSLADIDKMRRMKAETNPSLLKMQDLKTQDTR